MNQTTKTREPVPLQTTAGGQVATAESKQVTEFERMIEDHRPQIQAALPDSMDVNRFERVVVTAINNNPDLWRKADRRSLFNACVQAAADGLMPDGREGALVIYNTKEKDAHGRDAWVNKVQWMPMIAGVRKRMRNSGEVLSAVAHCVFGNDRFRYVLGDEELIEHEPALAERGELVGAYAVIKLKNGEVVHEYMSRGEIEEIRAASKAPNSPAWKNWYGEMARKSVLRRASKAAPMASEDEAFLHRADDYGVLLEQKPEDVPSRPTRAAIADETVKDDQPDPDPQTEPPVPDYNIVDPYGEIIVTYHIESDYLVSLRIEMEKVARRPDDVIAFWEQNEESIEEAKRAMGDDERAQPLYDDIVNLHKEAIQAKEAPEPQPEQTTEPVDEEKTTETVSWFVDLPTKEDGSPKWMQYYSDVLSRAKLATSGADIQDLKDANAPSLEDMAKTEKSTHQRLIQELDKRAKSFS